MQREAGELQNMYRSVQEEKDKIINKFNAKIRNMVDGQIQQN